MDPNDKKSSVIAIEVDPFTSMDRKSLEMGISEIGCYIGNKVNKIPSHGQGRHITD